MAEGPQSHGSGVEQGHRGVHSELRGLLRRHVRSRNSRQTLRQYNGQEDRTAVSRGFRSHFGALQGEVWIQTRTSALRSDQRLRARHKQGPDEEGTRRRVSEISESLRASVSGSASARRTHIVAVRYDDIHGPARAFVRERFELPSRYLGTYITIANTVIETQVAIECSATKSRSL